MTQFWEELQEFATALEVAREAVIEAARDACTGEMDGTNIAEAVKGLTKAERALGLKTAQLMRGAAAGGGIPAAPPLATLAAPPGVPEDTAKQPALPRPRRECTANPCKNWQNLQQCEGCSDFFCPHHLDQSFHPCGDIPEN